MKSYMALITKPVGYQDYETSCFQIKESRIYGKWILRELEVNNDTYLLLTSANYLTILDSAYNDVFNYKVLHDKTKSPAFQFDCYRGSGEVRCNVVGYASKDPILDDILNNKEKWAAESLITCYSSWKIDRNPASNDEIFMASYLSGELLNAYRIFWNGEAFELSKELSSSQKSHQFIGELKKYSQKPDF